MLIKHQKQSAKMNTDSAHPSRWTIAEVVFGIPFLAGVAIQMLVPFSLPQGILRQVLIPAGIALMVAGASLIVSARREFARYGQPTDPGHSTDEVIKTGVFAVSRNPLYLGGAIVFLGITFAFNIPWTLATLLLSIMLCHRMLIIPEEQYLAAKFGKEYQAYTASVHRWLGRKRTGKHQR